MKVSYKKPEGFLFNLEPAPKAPARPRIGDIAFKIKRLLDYEFSSEELGVLAIQRGAERKRLAELSCISNFGSDARIAAAAHKCGLKEILYSKRDVKESTLVTTVKALLGAVCEDSDDETDVLRPAYCLGLEKVEGDSLGVGGIRVCAVCWFGAGTGW